jgi:dihydrodiol dehydrogenase / D-xylose 1-dehydrogenase (NADP)
LASPSVSIRGNFKANYLIYLLKDARVVAVGGGHLDRAQKFASTHNIPRAYGSYDEVAADPEVEIVYICTLHPHHKEAALAASNRGKPVLCEKPLALNAKDAEAMIANARKNGTFFMEAMWTRYYPLTQKIASLVKQGRIGEVVSFDAKLGFQANFDQPRLGEKSHGASALLDVGIYVLTMASLALGPGAPKEIKAVGQLSKGADFDLSFAAALQYPSGAVATVQGSFLGALENTATIVGTKGRIHWQNHWCPTAFTIIDSDGTSTTFDPSTNPEYALPHSPGHVFNFHNSQGLAHEARYIQNALERGLEQSEHESLEESIAIMKTIDIIAKQIGFDNSS